MIKLPTREELINAGMPYGKTWNTLKGEVPYGIESMEWLRTEPDAVIFTPSIEAEGGNEQVQVIEVPGRDCLFAVWHQDSMEGMKDSRIVYSRSRDGQIWEEARILAGVHPGMEESECQAWYPYSIPTPSGRIYVFYIQQTEEARTKYWVTGIQMCRYTDDCGDTWSEPVNVPRKITCWDVPERGDLKTMFPIQNPIHLADGRYLCAYSEFADHDIVPSHLLEGVPVDYSLAYFAIFENILDDPEPADLQLTWLPDDPKGLHLLPENPPLSMVEEPFVVQLPNGWLFVVLRNFTGCIQYSVSEDLGHTWREPKPMRYADGELFVNPIAPPFLCDYGNGEYVQLYYGRFEGLAKMFYGREQVLRAVGTFAPEDEQPIRFEKKAEHYMAVDVAVGPRKHLTPEVNLEASFTRFHGVPMVWYSDRKHYVLGKKL